MRDLHNSRFLRLHSKWTIIATGQKRLHKLAEMTLSPLRQMIPKTLRGMLQR